MMICLFVKRQKAGLKTVSLLALIDNDAPLLRHLQYEHIHLKLMVGLLGK